MRLTDDEVLGIVTRLPLTHLRHRLPNVVDVVSEIVNAGVEPSRYSFNGARNDLLSGRPGNLSICRYRLPSLLRRSGAKACGDNCRNGSDEGNNDLHPLTPSP
ncbi:hypothetical protein [Streptomyces sp. R44]|uniref:Uncharacterized protein n=1 Tax=Streptomyces sp. R44 TaxID=3238633 RepID=A0AB39T4Y4_9ACTN